MKKKRKYIPLKTKINIGGQITTIKHLRDLGLSYDKINMATEPLSNMQKWQLYNEVLPSPSNYIDWAWLYTVSTCLQRRVWIGPETTQSCFPNMFMILVGRPGIGKGLILKEVAEFVKHWKLQDVRTRVGNNAKSAEDQQQIKMAIEHEADRANKIEFQGTSNKQNKDVIPPGLFHVAADSTTYQALIEAIGECYRSINYYEYNPEQKKDTLRVYRHSSTCFILPELASLMRTKTEDVVNFLLGLYDCPVDYEYRTISRQKDRVRRACVNLIAGTTPSYMQSTFDDRILNEGFSSRTFYIYAHKNRCNKFFIPKRNVEQEQYKKELLEHLFNLSQLCGHVQVEDGVYEWLQDWWDKYENDKALRANKNPKLEAYYARRNIHMMKIAMAHHFGESVLMKIPLKAFIWADEFLKKEEANMHLALVLEGNNNFSRAVKWILQLLQGGPQKRVFLYTELVTMLGNRKEPEDVLSFLEETDQIRAETIRDERYDREDKVYKIV
jgi:hypothetical protein